VPHERPDASEQLVDGVFIAFAGQLDEKRVLHLYLGTARAAPFFP
jgi:hypothetical protein